MEGGCILTNDDTLADYSRVLRSHGWIRDIKDKEKKYRTGNDFKDKFRFILPGYCVRPSELNAAVGQVQLTKWPMQIKKRLKNAKKFISLFKDKNVSIPEFKINSTWFGFPLLCNTKKQREKLIKSCKQNGIECRPIVAGNFVEQPVIKKLNYKISGQLKNAKKIEDLGIFFGNDSRNLDVQLKKLSELL